MYGALFENFQRLRGSRLPPFYNNLVTRGGICDMNRGNPTYVYCESVLEHSVYYSLSILCRLALDGALLCLG